jgi:hypothetical protein
MGDGYIEEWLKGLENDPEEGYSFRKAMLRLGIITPILIILAYLASFGDTWTFTNCMIYVVLITMASSALNVEKLWKQQKQIQDDNIKVMPLNTKTDVIILSEPIDESEEK